MNGYLGESVVDIKDTPFFSFDKSDWALYFIERYSKIDNSHYKQWVLDQVARILNDSKIIIKLATWSNGSSEYIVQVDEPSEKYLKWREAMLGEIDENGDYEYCYDEGIAP